MEFAWDKPLPARGAVVRPPDNARLSDEVLVRNARWFIRMRWIVVCILAVFQTVEIADGTFLSQFGMAGNGIWQAAVACVLAASNLWHTVALRNRAISGLIPPFANLWTQIIIDLACLTVVVHYLGSVGTPAPFLYVLHIVLAGIFFPRRASIIVVLMVWAGYSLCVVLESAGTLSPAGLLAGGLQNPAALSAGNAMLQTAVLEILFLLVWYFVSYLSNIIRTHEKELVEADKQMAALMKEKERYAVQVTHQMKSPLDVIRGNASLILNGYCGAFSGEAVEFIQRIDSKAKNLSRLLVDMLNLSRVSTGAETPYRTLDLAAILGECLAEQRTAAALRQITIEADIRPAQCSGDPEQVRLLLENILSNAVAYSYEGGKVQVRCGHEPGKAGVSFSVKDAGIGIALEKIPRIFEEYFRTKEACAHNSASSGIGLAIVKKIAQNHKLRISVESEPLKGTLFTVFFPEIKKSD